MLSGILYALAAGALWGFIFLASMVLVDYSSADIALGRFVVCGLISIILLLPRFSFLKRIMTWQLTLQALGLACLSYSFYFLALAEAIKLAGIVPATLVIGLLPITIPLLSHKNLTRPRVFYLSIALIVVGLGILNWPLITGITLPDGNRESWIKGLALALAALCMWTFFAPLNARVLLKHPHMDSSTWSSLLGLFAMITILPIWAVLTPDAGLPERLFESHYLLWMLLCGGGGSWLAGMCWNQASRRLPEALAGQLIISETIFSLIYGFIYGGRWPNAQEMMASALLVGGVVMGVRAFQGRVAIIVPQPEGPKAS